MTNKHDGHNVLHLLVHRGHLGTLNQVVSKDDWLATAQIRQHGHKHVLLIGMREQTRQGEVSWHEISNSTRRFADFFSF